MSLVHGLGAGAGRLADLASPTIVYKPSVKEVFTPMRPRWPPQGHGHAAVGSGGASGPGRSLAFGSPQSPANELVQGSGGRSAAASLPVRGS